VSSILVVDVGTSSVRASVVRDDATVAHETSRPLIPDSPAPGMVEFDAALLARTALDAARTTLAAHGPVDGVAITNQRASTVVWDRATGEPIGPGLGWQDLRTVFTCLELQAQGLRFAPNQSATKYVWLLDTFAADRGRDLCLGTVDSWIAWTLSGGELHVTDPSNAAVTGLAAPGATGWADLPLEALRIDPASLPTIVETCGPVGSAAALDGAPPIVALVGDQQASLLGQGCVRPGLAKITFGTGGMLDACTGTTAPQSEARSEAGTFPIIGWRHADTTTWGVEAIMLSAGTAVEWLVEDLGVLESAAASDALAASVPDAGGVAFVPALLGLGTPEWDFGARGALLGLTRGTGRAHITRAVLEGVAHRGADLVEAAEADAGLTLATLRIDGGMSANATFVQALADAAQRTVEVSPVLEATTLGAGLLGHVATGGFGSIDDLADTWRPRTVVEPGAPLDRDRWREAVRRASGWESGLSSLAF
jgi:glycerol kinase